MKKNIILENLRKASAIVLKPILSGELKLNQEKTHFDIYGAMAKENVPGACQNGRYSIQKDAEKYIPADVMSKLGLPADVNVLDIGCGLGLNTTPMAKNARHVTACDHPDVIAKTKLNMTADNITLIGGNFMEIGFEQSFERIIAYSVLPSLPNEGFMFDFVDKALNHLHPSGRMLLGDLSNSDKKSRFANSVRGKKFQKQWERDSAAHNIQNDLSAFANAGSTINFSDALILKLILHIRNRNYHAYVLDQPQTLPFGNTREDILIVGPEYDAG